jgi:hypothetical protein
MKIFVCRKSVKTVKSRFTGQGSRFENKLFHKNSLEISVMMAYFGFQPEYIFIFGLIFSEMVGP